MAKYQASMTITLYVENGSGTYINTVASCYSEDHDMIDDAFRQNGFDEVNLESGEPFPTEDGFYELEADFTHLWNDDGMNLWADNVKYKKMTLVEAKGPVIVPESPRGTPAVYAERKGFDQNFFPNLHEAIEYIIDGYHPNYDKAKEIEIFECEEQSIEPHVTAETIIEDIDNNIDMEEMPEGECWSDDLSEEGKKKLEEFLESWLPEMQRWVWTPTERKIEVNWDEEITKYLAARAHYDLEPVEN